MTRGPWTTIERSTVAASAIGAVAVALLVPHVWRWLVTASFRHAIEVAEWVTTVLAPLPACLALVAVVLTARPVGTAIGVLSAVVLLVANLQGLDDFRDLMRVEDYALWLVWSVLLGCALLGADVLAWRLGSFTVVTGAVAGLLVAVLETGVKLSMFAFGPGGLFPEQLPAVFWIREYAVPALMLVLAGGLAGAAARRMGARQETAGLA